MHIEDVDVDGRSCYLTYYEAENGDIVLTAPRGKIKIAAEAIEIIAKGSDGRTGVININADDKILLQTEYRQVNSNTNHIADFSLFLNSTSLSNSKSWNFNSLEESAKLNEFIPSSVN